MTKPSSSSDSVSRTGKKLAYSYVRFSRLHQERGDSKRRQRESTLEYCERNNLILDTKVELFDKGVSAFKGRNVEKGDLGRFIGLVEDGHVARGSALIVESLDRLSRQSPRKTIALLSTLLDLGIEVHLTSVGRVIRPDAGRDEGVDLITAVALAMRAHEESETKSMRLKAAFAKKRELAAKGNGVVAPSLPWWLAWQGSDDSKKIVAVPERAAVVRKIFELTCKGLGSAKIARVLNKVNTPTWRPVASKWLACRIRGLVNSEAPLGHLTATQKTVKLGRNHRIENYYPRVIDDETAALARAAMKKNTVGERGRPTKEGRPVNLLKGLIRHQGMWCRYGAHRNGLPDPETGIKAFRYYYECLNEDTSGKMLWSGNAMNIETLLLSGLLELKPEDLIPVASDAVVPLKAPAVREKLVELQKKAENLVAAVESGSTMLAKRLTEVESQIATVSKELKEAEAFDLENSQASTNVQVPKKELRSLLGNLKDNDTRERTAVVLNRMIREVEAADDVMNLKGCDIAGLVSLVDAHKKGGSVELPDPLATVPRAKGMALLVTFTSGAKRAIIRWKTEGKDGFSVLSVRAETAALERDRAEYGELG